MLYSERNYQKSLPSPHVELLSSDSATLHSETKTSSNSLEALQSPRNSKGDTLAHKISGRKNSAPAKESNLNATSTLQHLLSKEITKEEKKTVERSIVENMKAPESPKHSVDSNTHRKITKTLSNLVLPRKVDQYLRSLSGNDSKGRIQMAFFLSACRNAVAPEATKIFYQEKKLTESFSRFFRFAMEYFDSCLKVQASTAEFTKIEHYDKFLTSIRGCQLLLFKNDKEQSKTQNEIFLEIQEDLTSIKEILRVYILLMTRKAQLAIWEEKYGFAAALLRRIYLDLIARRMAIEDNQNGLDDSFDKLELFLQNVILKCGEAVSNNTCRIASVFMTDEYPDKHTKKKAIQNNDHNVPRHKLFEHCQELIFELPAKKIWGFKLRFHKTNHIMCIEQITPKSPAETAGLKVGDYIDEIGGDQLHEGGVDKAMSFIKQHKEKELQNVEVVVYRELNEDGEVAAMNIQPQKRNNDAELSKKRSTPKNLRMI